jgi:endonuclease/exonuclease/phosphatase family metal-dependent hydrolase
MVAILRYMLPALWVLVLLSCRGPSDAILVSWNVQNLFDGQSNGWEYPEFDPKLGQWNQRKYQERLKALAGVLREIHSQGPDLILLLEVENLGVLEDLIAGYFPLSSYLAPIWIGPPSGGIGYGVVSRLPIERVKVHHLACRQTVLRPILEIDVVLAQESMTVFCNHWKSRKEGAVATSLERRTAADLISRRAQAIRHQDRHRTLLVLGDLNESFPGPAIQGFAAFSKQGLLNPLVLRVPADPPSPPERVVWTEPWLPGETGISYWFQGQGEAIDHAFVSYRPSGHGGQGTLQAGLQVWPTLKDPNTGGPWRYDSRRGKGLSDHFPLLMRLRKAY